MTWKMLNDGTVEPTREGTPIGCLERGIKNGDFRLFAHLEGCRRAGCAVTPILIRAEKVYSGTEIIENDWSVKGLKPVGIVVNVFNDGVNPPALVSSRIIETQPGQKQ
jgi:hypothetical protein